MAYDLAQFVADCRGILSRDPGPAGREAVRQRLERLLANADFIARHCGPAVPAGLSILYEDPALGFQILAHNNERGRRSPPHDHGESWAIYGQATGHTDMTEYERPAGAAGRAHLRVTKSYRLNPGQAGIYQDGAIHAIDYPNGARFIRVTGTNLDRIRRTSFDLATGEMRQMAPTQAS